MKNKNEVLGLFSQYSGNIYDSKCKKHITYDDFIKMQTSTNIDLARIFEAINKASINKNTKLKRLLKQGLPAFTPSVLIPVDSKRSYNNIDRYTGIMQLDFDKLNSEHDAGLLKYRLFEDAENTAVMCAYLSPSKLGVKALIKIDVPRSKEHYKALHKSITKYYQMFEGGTYKDNFDMATKNAVLPLFLSNDKDILHTKFENTKAWTEADFSVEDRANFVTKQPQNFNFSNNNVRGTAASTYYLNRTIRLFVDKVKNISSDGHPQLRTACLILGSRVGAGYIEENEAIDLLRGVVRSQAYLSKNKDGYLRTGEWAIKEGTKNPLYYANY